MKAARIYVIVGFFLTVSVVVMYKIITRELVSTELKKARIAYEAEKLRVEQERLQRYNILEAEKFTLKRTNLRRDNELYFYGTIGMLSVFGVSVIILATGYSLAKLHRASVYFARIGQHSEIPVHQKDLQTFYPIAVNLSLAEIEASVSTAHDQAYQISRHMLEDILAYTRAIAGNRGMLPADSGHLKFEQWGLPTCDMTPKFADLLTKRIVAPGKPLVLGYDRQGQPQYRSLQDLKSVAIAGWQGSGKTLSMAYIVASSILADGVQVYLIDPHKQHPESLYARIKPLEKTGHVNVVNPFETPALIETLNRTLDQRLAGQAPNTPGILLVIDELARLAKMECFEVLVKFLERCTEETRKANITFIGGSPKWTARYFKGRADIRGCMNSMLIHKTKPSQADLLLEDAHDKNLVKQLHRPGEAILVTDYGLPTLISMPLCTPQDMEAVAQFVGRAGESIPAAPTSGIAFAEDARHDHSENTVNSTVSETGNAPPPPISKEVISFELHRKKHDPLRYHGLNPMQLTVEMIQEQIQKRKQQEPGFTQAEAARQAGISPSVLSRILKGQRPLNDDDKRKLYGGLFASHVEEPRVVGITG